MVFVTAACLVIRQHRREIARREAKVPGIREVNSQSGHENVSSQAYVGSGRAGMHNAVLGAIPVQQPPPVYIPEEAAPGLDEALRFLVSMDYTFEFPRTEAIPQLEAEGWCIFQWDENSCTPCPGHTCRYFDAFDQPRGSRRRGPLRGWNFVIKLQTPTYIAAHASTADSVT